MWPQILQRRSHSEGLSPPRLAVSCGSSAHRFVLTRALSCEQPGHRATVITKKISVEISISNEVLRFFKLLFCLDPKTVSLSCAPRIQTIRICWVCCSSAQPTQKPLSHLGQTPYLFPQPRVPRFHHKACDNEINGIDGFPFYNCHGNYIVTFLITFHFWGCISHNMP